MVTTARECAWTAEAEVAWLSIRSGASGQGDGAIEYTAAVNPDPQVRRGTINTNGQRAEIAQAAGVCVFTLSEPGADFSSGAGSGRVEVRTASPLCTWTAQADAPWITLRSAASAAGNGTVLFDVAANTGAARTGTLRVAGEVFTIAQASAAQPPTPPEPGPPPPPTPCAYVIAPENASWPAAGGSGSVTVTTGPECVWAAQSAVPWIVVTAGAAGTGPGAVQYAVAPTTGPSRSGTVTIAGRTLTVNQGQGCTFTLSPDNLSVPAAGAQAEFQVQTAAGCAWTATEDSSWLSISSGSSGSGPGTVRFAATANTGPARSALITAAGRTFNVNQDAGCTFTLSASSQAVDSAGGTGSVGVTSAAGCAWTAASQALWISLTSGATGSGNGTVGFRVAANSGPARSGTITIAGRPFTITQGANCSYAIAPEQQAVDIAGGSGSVAVAATAGCGWTAVSSAPWLTITAGASGTGDGSVAFAAGANSGPARSGTLTIAGRTFTVSQGSGCSYSVSTAGIPTSATGGIARVDVASPGACAWTAASDVPWVTIAPLSGAGNGTVDVTVDVNTGPARNGTVTIAGRALGVSQESGCTAQLSAASQSMPAAGGTGVFSVTTPAGCTWTAVSQVSWIQVTAGASGAGDGTAQFTVEPNLTGAARSGTILIAGQTFTVNQE